jgi:hypothetical protein
MKVLVSIFAVALAASPAFAKGTGGSSGVGGMIHAAQVASAPTTAVALAPVARVVPSETAGYHRASMFEQVKARCELMADGSYVGHVAIGNPYFVTGAAIGAGIANAIRHSRAYDVCMTMSGYARDNP